MPEGGFDAWMQVVGSWVVLAATWGLVNSFGVFQTYYEADLLAAHSASSISWIGSLQGALLLMLGTVSGPLYDAGYFRPMLWAGLFLIVLGQFMVSLATEFWHVLLAQGVCVGIGCGLTFLPATAIVAQYFSRRRALVMGICATGSPVAGLVIPIVFGRLQPKIGFGWATRVIAFIILAMAVVPLVTMRTRLPPTKGRRAVVDRAALREPAFVLFTASMFFFFLGMYVVFFYIEVFAVHHGIGAADFRPYFVSLLSAASVAGRIGPPYLADKLGALNIMTGVIAACAALCFGWVGIRTQPGLLAFVVLYGCFSGAIVSVMAPAVVSLSPTLDTVGTRMGMVFFFGGISLLIGTPIAGVILGGKSDAEWTGVAVYAGACLVAACVVMALARWQHSRVTGSHRA
jgi:predicted MFS family arabinose efflux permease